MSKYYLFTVSKYLVLFKLKYLLNFSKFLV